MGFQKTIPKAYNGMTPHLIGVIAVKGLHLATSYKLGAIRVLYIGSNTLPVWLRYKLV